jgi:hypothetical protein
MIKGKPLPPVEEVTPPDTQRLDELVAMWNANCPKFYVGLLEAGRPNSRFVYDAPTLTYRVKGGRKLTREEVSKVYGETMKKIGVR